MERERQSFEQLPVTTSGGQPTAGQLEADRIRLTGLLERADQVLDSIHEVAAEDYLQQSRQRGAQ